MSVRGRPPKARERTIEKILMLYQTGRGHDVNAENIIAACGVSEGTYYNAMQAICKDGRLSAAIMRYISIQALNNWTSTGSTSEGSLALRAAKEAWEIREGRDVDAGELAHRAYGDDNIKVIDGTERND